MTKIIVIKIGSQSIMGADGKPNKSFLTHMIEQIVMIQSQNVKVILVSSGAVALGRVITKNNNSALNTGEKQLLASIGQPQLMAMYNELCNKFNLVVAQLLLTKYDFQTKRNYNNILNLITNGLSQSHALMIINENDSVAIEELIFTDNDELAGIIATQIGADKLILLTNVDGVYDGNPSDPQVKLISIIKPTDQLPKMTLQKSILGRGGMRSKLTVAMKMAHVGITTHIANANVPNILLRLIIDNEQLLGTTVLAKNKQSALKRYLAVNTDKPIGYIIIKHDLVKLLLTSCVSILPVGIESFHGVFDKGDVIDVLTTAGKKVCSGIAKYNHLTLQNYLGIHNKPIFMHYNYIYIHTLAADA